MNLLPIPVLDGGALPFGAAKWLRGRPASEGAGFATRTGVATMAAMFIPAMLHGLAGLGLFRFLASP